MRYLSHSLLSSLVLVLVLASATTQAIDFGDPGDLALPGDADFIEGEFAFVRLRYNSLHSRGFRGQPWNTDYPAADQNFLRGVSRLTNIRVKSDPIVLTLEDERIFNYPFLYALEMGRGGGVVFNEREMARLREYLLRGGFLFIDDFWGTYQWDAFHSTFMQVFPDKELVELSPDHEIFHVFYDVDGPQMIPAMNNPQNIPEQDVAFASNWALMDDDGRIMVLINWNSDIGDGWEHTYWPAYPTKYANLAYQLGINYLVYSLTH